MQINKVSNQVRNFYIWGYAILVKCYEMSVVFFFIYIYNFIFLYIFFNFFLVLQENKFKWLSLKSNKSLGYKK